MITSNSKLTALEVLTECGVQDAVSKFSAMRVRIGGISGINRPDYLVNIPAETKTLEVIVGGEIYDLELSKGNKQNNAEIRTISDEAKIVLELEGIEDTKTAEKIQEVKQVAKLLREGGEFKPTNKKEEELLTKAQDLNISHNEAIEAAEKDRDNKERTTVKSK